MTVVENKWLSGPYAPIPGDVTATELEVVGTLPDRAQRPLPPQRARTRSPPSTRPPTTGSWATAWCTACGSGRAGPTGTGPAWCAAPPCRELLGEEPAPGERHGGFDRRQHQRDRPRPARPSPSSRRAPGRWSSSYELDTVCHTDLEGTLPNGYTAHPKVDPATGKLHALAYHWALPHLQYIVIGADGLVEKVSPIDVTDGPMVHDCSITERWMVVYDLPVAVRPRRPR